jgi:hypothetical protein
VIGRRAPLNEGLISKIQSDESNGALALSAIIGGTNFGEGFFEMPTGTAPET